MTSARILYIAALTMSGLLAAGTTVHVWRPREALGGVPMAVTMLGVAIRSLGDAASVARPSLLGKVLFESLPLTGRVIPPTGWLVFSLEYTRQERWQRTPGHFSRG